MDRLYPPHEYLAAFGAYEEHLYPPHEYMGAFGACKEHLYPPHEYMGAFRAWIGRQTQRRTRSTGAVAPIRRNAGLRASMYSPAE